MKYCLAALFLVGLTLWAADAIVPGEPCKQCEEKTCPNLDKQKCLACHENRACAECKAGTCKICQHCKVRKAKKAKKD
ncbi:MAG: hypothetical protein RL095_2701 [Verrucomicrobiota bacterium]|jgi:hypothetical protein